MRARAASGYLHTPRRAAKSPTHTARRSAWSFVSALNQQFVHKAEHNPNERPGKQTAPNYRPPSIELPFQFRASTFARFLICQRPYVLRLLRLFDCVHKRSLSKRRLKRGVFHSVVDLQAAINRFLAKHNQQPKPFSWTADPDKIIAAVRRGNQALNSIY